ncbi:phosphotransferase family protein [Rhodococcoides yunnanense]|uniref:phosphotransferase family protein n=1 Tax=Rhodococcoides yunnanense TaxID=278209 RepID=UPI0009347370|nr:phosphotransferase family protein [Rhodococcus yunnanensis]
MSMVNTALKEWFAEHIIGAREVDLLSDVSKLAFGFSNETFVVGVGWTDDAGARHEKEYVLRLPPPGENGLLAPYDIGKQYQIMGALKDSPIPVPAVLWYEEGTEIFGRPFFVMEKLDGTAFEKAVPSAFANFAPDDARDMARRAVTMIAHVAQVDWKSSGIDCLGDTADPTGPELDRWVTYFEGSRVGEMPAFGLIIDWLRANKPQPSGRIGLLHGDAKWGNFMWADDGQVVSFNDWEMASLGDPLIDLSYFLCTTFIGGSENPFPMKTGLSRLEVIALYSELTGIDVKDDDLRWYEVLNYFKLASIIYRMQYLFAIGASDDLRFAFSKIGLNLWLGSALRLIGADPATDPGIPPIDSEKLSAAAQKTLRDSVIPALDSPQIAEQAALVAAALGHLTVSV